MEAKDHFKNGASWENLKILSISIFLFVFMPFSYGISKEKIVNVGGTKFYGGPFSPAPKSSPSHGLNVNAGVKSTFFENGIYYGYNHLRKFEVLSRAVHNDGSISKSLSYSDDMASFHTLGAYSNFYLSSLLKNKDFFRQTFNFYATVKLGGYYVPAKDIDCTGVGLNCYFGTGAVLYPTKRLGIFGEIGLDYFTYMDCELNRLSIRAGISIRI
jgi:hypothetical protein